MGRGPVRVNQRSHLHREDAAGPCRRAADRTVTWTPERLQGFLAQEGLEAEHGASRVGFQNQVAVTKVNATHLLLPPSTPAAGWGLGQRSAGRIENGLATPLVDEDQVTAAASFSGRHDQLSRRKGLRLQQSHEQRLKPGRHRQGEEGNSSADHVPVDVKDHLTPQRCRQLLEDLGLSIKRRHLLVPELDVPPNGVDNLLVEAVLLAVLPHHEQRLGCRVLTTMRGHLCHAAYDIAKHRGSEDHHADCKDTLDVVHGKDVAIAHSGHGGKDPV
mmetsp:Transcript_27191/g.63820  ORF Transcript_27191/g.63820 Transcript_27191/m.63820 type:complete len:273 (-) Transcript_27191:859-1677(-)